MSHAELNSAVRDVIASRLRPRDGLCIGVEVENIIYDKHLKRIPVNPSATFSTADLKERLEEKNAAAGIAPTLSIEPGGQMEYASAPYCSLRGLADEWRSYLSHLLQIAEEEHLIISDFALEPVTPADDITIIDHRKYKLMYARFGKTGEFGHEMMLNSASDQINLDYTSPEEANRMAFAADCLHPFVALIFANTPFYRGEPSGRRNWREIIWRNTDPARSNCLMDHGIESADDLINSYADYILTVPTIFTFKRDGSVGTFDGSLGDWLASLSELGDLQSSDVMTALHQIFTQVRFKHILEIRGPDRPPFGFELAPAAFFQGILRSRKILEKVLGICVQWTASDRQQLNEMARTLDFSQTWGGKTLQSWCEQFLSLSLDGLEKTEEKTFLEPFVEQFLSNGPFSLAIQMTFERSGKSVEQFMEDRWAEQKESLKEITEA